MARMSANQYDNACHAGHPFDTLKVCAHDALTLQNADHALHDVLQVLMQMQPDKYKSFGDAAKETIKKHGFGGLYKGVGSPLVGNGLYNAVQFAAFANIKKMLTDDGRNVTLNRIAASAAITGVFVACVEGVCFDGRVPLYLMCDHTTNLKIFECSHKISSSHKCKPK